MKKLIILLLTSVSLLAQTTCETSEESNIDLNVISVKKCLVNQENTNSLQNESRKVNTKNLEKRFLTVRKVVKKNKVLTAIQKDFKKNKVSSFQNDITSSGVVTKDVNNMVTLEVFPKKLEVIERFTTVDIIPQFKTCKKVKTKKEMKSCFNTEIINFVNNNIVYPENAINAGVNGEIVVKFVIDRQGNVNNINVVGDKNSRSLKEEVIDLMNSLPQLKPAVKEGENVPVSFEFSLDFTL